MSENIPTNVEMDTNGNGSVSFAAEVVATIAGLAATEVEGVATMASNTSGGIADLFSKRASTGKNLTKGVKVDVQEGKVIVNVNFIVEYGFPVPEVAKNIQENVKKAIETMSGLNVEAVDVHVSGVSFEKENQAVAEIEQQQRLLLQKQQEGERNNRLKSDPIAQAAVVEKTVSETAEEALSSEDEIDSDTDEPTGEIEETEETEISDEEIIPEEDNDEAGSR